MKLALRLLVPTFSTFALISSISADAEEAHHQPDPATGTPTVTAPSEQPTAPSTQMMMPMMNMMGQPLQGTPMMSMMGQGGMGMMGMMGQGAMPMAGGMANPDMPMLDMGAHLEGRIAFLRAELGITEAQTTQWDSFAQALRDSAAKMKQAGATMSQPTTEPAAFLRRAELQEQWLSARLEGIKGVKTAFTELQTVLSEDQRKTAEALLTRPVCFGQMGMM